MKYKIGYQATTSGRISYELDYKCSFCQKENHSSSYLWITKEANGNVFADPGRLTDEARQKVFEYIRNAELDVRQRKYRKLQIREKCQYCRKKPLWARFFPVSDVAKKYRDLLSNKLGFILVIGAFLDW